jgi:hypothetical protein
MNAETYDAKLGYVPVIPEPFWYRGLRTLFRYRPACYQCGKPLIFQTRAEWDIHYVLTHMTGEELD